MHLAEHGRLPRTMPVELVLAAALHHFGFCREIVTKAEGYMLFRKGVEPSTEYEVSPGVRATQNRRRAELSVRKCFTRHQWL
jgi:hypothetical protein